MRLFNTLTNKKEEFEPIKPGHVKLYVCGPTVYNYPHIGNARPPVVFDVLSRLLRSKFKVTYVRNITDVDDKINSEALRKGISIYELTSYFLKVFTQDMASLGVLPPDIEPKVTDHIPEIVSFIDVLVKKEYAYENQGHVYFDVSSFKHYGKLSGRKISEMLAGARVSISELKKNPGDFVLWKPSSENTIGWDSPWGFGRPGWHIECSVMSHTHLGKKIDIHGGGSDLIFPHHENEVAQSECALGITKFSNFWLHNGLIRINSEKMSKSLGNMLLVSDLLIQANGESIRMALLGTHYRQPLEWTDTILREAKDKLDKLYNATLKASPSLLALTPKAIIYAQPVIDALEDDLNTPRAITELFKLAKQVNLSTNDDDTAELVMALKYSSSFLGLLQKNAGDWFRSPTIGSISEDEILRLIEQRNTLREEKRFSEADNIRKKLLEKGIAIEDQENKTVWKTVN
jgi:cysteinyl-tRNA synthetase